MTRDAFRRLALMVACSAWLAAIAATWLWLDWIVAAAAILGGTVVAAALTVEPDPRTKAERNLDAHDRLLREQQREKVGSSIRDIERRARAARAGDDVA